MNMSIDNLTRDQKGSELVLSQAFDALDRAIDDVDDFDELSRGADFANLLSRAEAHEAIQGLLVSFFTPQRYLTAANSRPGAHRWSVLLLHDRP